MGMFAATPRHGFDNGRDNDNSGGAVVIKKGVRMK